MTAFVFVELGLELGLHVIDGLRLRLRPFVLEPLRQLGEIGDLQIGAEDCELRNRPGPLKFAGDRGGVTVVVVRRVPSQRLGRGPIGAEPNVLHQQGLPLLRLIHADDERGDVTPAGIDHPAAESVADHQSHVITARSEDHGSLPRLFALVVRLTLTDAEICDAGTVHGQLGLERLKRLPVPLHPDVSGAEGGPVSTIEADLEAFLRLG